MRTLSYALSLSCLGLGACATATDIHGPDGQQAVLIECPGAAVPMSACFEKANEVCPSGYKLLDAQEGGSAASFTQFGAYSATGVQKRIVVRCQETLQG
jgi:hypothetical protein